VQTFFTLILTREVFAVSECDKHMKLVAA
jgi:hypothetical protein